jgi:hypothetical protein
MLFTHVGRIPACRLALTLAIPLFVLGGRALAAQPFGQQTVIACPFHGFQGAEASNGFYVKDYSGTTLSQVTLAYDSSATQTFAIALTARRGSYDGPLIGTTQRAVVNVPSTTTVFVTFDFGGAPVSPGDTVTFTHSYVGEGTNPGLLFYDEGSGSCPGVFVTSGTPPPPLGSAHDGVGVTITELVPTAGACVASDTVLCVDDVATDQRFQVTATFQTVQDGGASGTAQAIPLAPVGPNRGGLFWFFSDQNPEILVKILNGCAINDHYWAFVSATTNVGYSLTVSDTTLANRTRTYTNPDRTVALPVADTSALSCERCATNADCRSGLLCCATPFGNACLAPAPGGVCPLIP